MRPRCAHCGAAYGRRSVDSVTVKWPLGEEMPPYRGNGKVVKVGFTYQTTRRETMRQLMMLSVNPTIRKAQEEDLARMPDESENVCTVWVWDGETWQGGYEPFCTMRCALNYARKAIAKFGSPRAWRS